MGINWGKEQDGKSEAELLSPKKHFKAHEIQEFKIDNEFKPKKTEYGENMFGKVIRTSDNKAFFMFLKDEYDIPKLEEAYGTKSAGWIGKKFFLKAIPSGKGNPYFVMGIPEDEIDIGKE